VRVPIAERERSLRSLLTTPLFEMFSAHRFERMQQVAPTAAAALLQYKFWEDWF